MGKGQDRQKGKGDAEHARDDIDMGAASSPQGPDTEGWPSQADLNKMGKGHELIRLSVVDRDVGNIVACQKCRAYMQGHLTKWLRADCKGSEDGSEPAKLRSMQEGWQVQSGAKKYLRQKVF
eukprot:1233160-Amphidinium_carterae.1